MSLSRVMLKVFLSVFSILGITLALWLLSLNSEINERLEGGWFPPAIEVYSEGETLFVGAAFKDHELEELLTYSGLHQQKEKEMGPLQYKRVGKSECLFNLSGLVDDHQDVDNDLIKNCILIKNSTNSKSLIVLDLTNKISKILVDQKSVSQWQLQDFLVAQYHENTPFLRSNIKIGDIPLQCLQAITAVEDNEFLQHQGISIKGILRAVVKNLTQGSIAEGASTITQQLVKNYFLTPERTFKRKFKELFMAILLEAKVSKDDILSNYLNVIYLGQSGPFQVRGYAAAARFYFQKEIQQLNLQDCALLAAIVNNPGRYNPFRKPENAAKRRTKVLGHMLKETHISKDEYATAIESPLPKKPQFINSQFSSYFLDAIDQEVNRLEIPTDEGLKIYTTLSPYRQIHAQKSVLKVLNQLKEKKQIKGKGIDLQASLINIDVRTGAIRSLLGGKDFQTSPFNRALNAKRQVGSIMKPFVYLSALESTDSDGNPYHALYLLADKLTTHKYEGQSWAPKNYSRTYQGEVPLFYALKNSINSPTASLGMSLGIGSVIDIAKRLGIQTELKSFPSLTLGALELGQLELAQAYVNIANLGEYKGITFIQKVTDLSGEVLFDHTLKNQVRNVVSPEASAQLTSLLQQTVQTGTARSLKSWRKFLHPIAGKTGTTNDTKDAWFVGFTPDTLTLVWVGNDTNKSTSLTGSSGALPIWAEYMKKTLLLFPVENEFPHPESLTFYILDKEVLKRIVPSAKDHELINTRLLMSPRDIDNFETEQGLTAPPSNVFNKESF